MVTTFTTSEKVTVIAATSPILRVPFEVVEVTLETVGTTPSITRALLLLKLLEAPGEANVNVAAFPAAPFIDPPFKARELVAL